MSCQKKDARMTSQQNSKKAPASMFALLDHDVVRLIAGHGLDVSLRVASVCTEWRRAIEDAHGDPFGTRQLLVGLGETSLLGELVACLCLPPVSLKLYPHRLKRRHNGGFYKIFAHATAVHIFHAHGGAAMLETRLARRAKRAQRHVARC